MKVQQIVIAFLALVGVVALSGGGWWAWKHYGKGGKTPASVGAQGTGTAPTPKVAEIQPQTPPVNPEEHKESKGQEQITVESKAGKREEPTKEPQNIAGSPQTPTGGAPTGGLNPKTPPVQQPVPLSASSGSTGPSTSSGPTTSISTEKKDNPEGTNIGLAPSSQTTGVSGVSTAGSTNVEAESLAPSLPGSTSQQTTSPTNPTSTTVAS